MPRYARSPLIASTGRTLVNTLVRPRDPIPPEVTEIHGITNADVAKAPTFRQVMGAHGGRLRKLLDDSQRPIAIYNAVFDLRMVDQSLGTDRHYHRRANAHCVMHLYAQYYGDWSDWHGSYTWQSLGAAASQLGLVFDNPTELWAMHK